MKSNNKKVLDHLYSTFKSLNKCRKDGLLCDVQIVVGENTFDAHRYVLAVYSDHFKKIFSEQPNQHVIKIDDIVPQAMEHCIEFMYTGESKVCEKNVKTVWQAAYDLQLPGLCDTCVDYFMSEMNEALCLQARELSVRFGCNKLKKAADKFAAENFNLVCKQEEFLHLSISDVLYFLSAKSVRHCSSEIIYNAILEWVKFNSVSRTDYFLEMLKFVRFNELSTNFLMQVVRNEPMLQRYKQAMDKLEMEVLSRLCKNETNLSLLLFDKVSDSIEAYNTVTKKSYQIDKPKSLSLSECTPLIVGEYLYVLSCSTSYRLNCLNKTAAWNKIAQTSIERCTSPKASSISQYIYITGGKTKTGNVVTPVGEFYNPYDDTWSRIANLPNSRDGHVSVSCESYLFCIGGTDGTDDVLDTTVVFDPDHGKWYSLLSQLLEARTDGTGIWHNGKIYIFGGRTKNGCLISSLEVLDPMSDDGWARLVFGITPSHSLFSVGIVDGVFYAVGYTEDSTSTIEVINMKTVTWNLFDEFKNRKYIASVVAKI